VQRQHHCEQATGLKACTPCHSAACTYTRKARALLCSSALRLSAVTDSHRHDGQRKRQVQERQPPVPQMPLAEAAMCLFPVDTPHQRVSFAPHV